jgi:hypothetical protein
VQSGRLPRAAAVGARRHPGCPSPVAIGRTTAAPSAPSITAAVATVIATQPSRRGVTHRPACGRAVALACSRESSGHSRLPSSRRSSRISVMHPCRRCSGRGRASEDPCRVGHRGKRPWPAGRRPPSRRRRSRTTRG